MDAFGCTYRKHADTHPPGKEKPGVAVSHDKPRIGQIMDTYPVLIGGKTRGTDEIADVRFPYTGEVYARVCQARASDLEDALASAVTGFEKMRRLSSSERSKILDRLADEIHRRADDLVHAMVMEGGKTKKFATAEVARAEMTVRTSAEEARRIYGEILPARLDRRNQTPHRLPHAVPGRPGARDSPV